jgi:hypothetical protein
MEGYAQRCAGVQVVITKIKQGDTKMLSYHNDPAVKAWHVEQARYHYEMDMLRAGTYGISGNGYFKGCSVGCMAHDIDPKALDNWHEIVAKHAGWPKWLVRLNDSIFEGLPLGKREYFHVDLREAIPVGVDLEIVRHKLALRRIDRLIELQKSNRGEHGASIDAVISQVLAVLSRVRHWHESEIGGNVCELEAAARSAAEAARSAAEARSERSTRSASFEHEASDLLELLMAATSK